MKRLFRLPSSRARVQRDVDSELRFHLQGRVEELMARGMSREDAEREAQRRFGDRTAVAQELQQIDVVTYERRALGERLSSFGRDARYAARGLMRRPLYAFAVVVTLALAVGANTAVFSVFKRVLLHPLDVPAIDRLAVVQDDYPLMNQRFGVSALEAIDLFERRDLFAAATAASGVSAVILIGNEPTQTQGVTTLGEFTSVFAARPMLGRFYRPEDSQFGRPPVVVLSHRLWQQLGGDSAIVGRMLALSDRPHEIVGVMPPEFTPYPSWALFWRPLVLDSVTLNQERSRGTVIHTFTGRMRDGLTTEQLAAELRALSIRWHETYTSNYKVGGHMLVVTPLVAFMAGQLKPIVIALLATVGLVLLIACANVASLQLMHATGRTRELAVRAALGAGRGAIARQVIIESSLLAVAGGIVGLMVGFGGLTWLTRLNIADFPALKDVQLDGTVLAFTAGIVVVASLLFGSAPALRAARVGVNDALRESTRGSSAGIARHRFLRASVILQNALTVVLLVGAALTIRSLDRLTRVELGFQPQNAITFTVSLPRQRYGEPAQRLAFFSALEERLRAIPGVQGVGFALGTPFSGSGGSTLYTLPDIAKLPGERDRHANQAFVFGDYFRTMGISIVRGRAFTPADNASGGHTIIVDEALVRQSFGDRDPIGAQIEHGASGTIIGVAKSVKLADLTEAAHPLVYHNYGSAAFTMALTAVVRSTLPTDAIVSASHAAVRELDPALPLRPARALTERIAESYGSREFATRVLTIFAALSLGLALLGVRLALGAARGGIARMVLRDGALLAAIGLGLGVAAYLGLGRVLKALLFQVGLLDPFAIGGAIALLAGITLLASYLPARRAVRVDPLVTMRAE
jgi:putative ABC transport system permease protein